MAPLPLAALLAACGGPPPERPPPEPPPPVVARPVDPMPAPADGSAGPVPIELQYVGVGDLHQRWFGDPKLVQGLAAALSSCVRERAVVRMTWDDQLFTGSIRLYVDERTLACHPANGPVGVDLAPLAALGRALAAYRDGVAAAYDFRVASFKVELESLRGRNLCRLALGGQFPPDGSTWSPCVDLGGRVSCAGPQDVGLQRFAFPDAGDTAYLAACLAP